MAGHPEKSRPDDELDPAATVGEPKISIPDGIGPDELDELDGRAGRYPTTIFEILDLGEHRERVAALRDAGIAPESAALAVIERALDELARLDRVPGYSLRTAPQIRHELRRIADEILDRDRVR